MMRLPFCKAPVVNGRTDFRRAKSMPTLDDDYFDDTHDVYYEPDCLDRITESGFTDFEVVDRLEDCLLRTADD